MTFCKCIWAALLLLRDWRLGAEYWHRGFLALHRYSIPGRPREDVVLLYDPADPSKFLSLFAFRNTFQVQSGVIKVRRNSNRFIMCICTIVLLVGEVVLLVGVPAWTGSLSNISHLYE